MQKSLVFAVLGFSVLLQGGCERLGPSSSDFLTYPIAPPLAHTDILHDTPIHDPYRWLEEDATGLAQDEAAAPAWLAAQRALSNAYFAQIPSRAVLRDSLARLWHFERREAPRRFGERWFLFRNTGSADHYALAMQSDLSAEPVTLLDPADWSDTQGLLAAVSISPDGRYLAWLQTNAQGLDRRWQIRDLNAARGTADLALDWLDVDDIAWHSASSGFFYSASVAQGDGTATGIYFHALQRDASDSLADAPVHISAAVLQVMANVDGRWLLALEEIPSGAAAGTMRALLLDLEHPESLPSELGVGALDSLRFLGARAGRLFLLSTLDDPAGSVISIDAPANGVMSPTVIVPPERRQILRALPIEDGVLVEYLDAGMSVLERVAEDGTRHSLPLPGLGRITSLYPAEFDDEVLYSFSTLTSPGGVFRLNTSSGENTILFAPDLNFTPDEFVVQRLDVPLSPTDSIPVLVAGRRDRLRAADSNLLLEVYGGFGISMDTGFSSARMEWMAQGGVYAIAAVRGGGELGPQWHEQAKVSEKHRSIDDLILVAQQLRALGYVDQGRLAVMGASHGAMLVAAAVNRDPTLFAAAVLSAGPMDMLRIAELGGAASWQEEYGSAQKAEQFAALLDYSPYHNVRSGAIYPSILLLTSEHDAVVAPAHSYKYAARLQAEVDPARPVLLQIRSGAGHLDTGTVNQLIEQYADRWAFLLHELGR